MSATLKLTHKAIGAEVRRGTYDILVDGVQMVGQVDKKLRLLRRIPVDPMTNSTEWSLRSVQDDPKMNAWGGQDVFDVHTKSEGVAFDGTKYKDW